jgi:hypothetical protein
MSAWAWLSNVLSAGSKKPTISLSWEIPTGYSRPKEDNVQLKYFNETSDPLIKGLTDTLLLMLDSAREAAGIPLIITSGLRSPGGNSVLKGAVPDSSHLTGQAVDLHVQDDTHFWQMIHGLDQAQFQRIGLYFSVDPVTKILTPRHIHVDFTKVEQN